MASNLSVGDLTIAEGSTVSTLSGTLSPGTRTNIDRFSGSAGETVLFQNLSASSTAANWMIVGPNGVVVGGPTNISNELQALLPTDGSYELVISGSDAADLDYQFQVSATAPAPQPLSDNFNVAQTGSIAPGETQTYQFTAPAGQVAFLDIQDNPSYDLQFILSAPDGHQILSQYYTYDGGPVLLPASGQYTLTVSGSDSSSAGDYQFVLRALPTGATPLTLGATTEGNLATPDSVDAYAFTGAAGQQLSFDGLSGSGISAYVYSPSLGLVWSGSVANDSSPLVLAQSGMYHVLISGSSASSTSYAFRLLDTASSSALSTDGTPVDGTFGSDDAPLSTSTNLYTLAATAGHTYYLTAPAYTGNY
jgi:hypothetical protein